MTSPPVVRSWVYSHEYRDSMVLMNLSTELATLPGIRQAMAIMGTEANKELLATVGLAAPESELAGPNDLVVAVGATDRDAAQAAEDRLREMLAGRHAVEAASEYRFRTLESAAHAQGDSNLALISVPGPHAAREARRALDLGLHVLLFSDSVPLEDEIELKRIGGERGLLVMGPDCGTAIVNGVALGFANAVRRGTIGIVGASGTGIQELCALIDRSGLGVSHALGTGGRDLSARVGGATTFRAMELLEADPETKVLVLISKPPAPEVAARLLERAARCGKPVVVCLLGWNSQDRIPEGTRVVATLSEAAAQAVALAGGGTPIHDTLTPEDAAWAAGQRALLAPGQRFVRGLFSGGTLCHEAMIVWKDSLGDTWSNVPLEARLRLPDPQRSQDHAAIDLGDDLFTLGRPHPMIDPSLRQERILAEAGDPSVAVLMLDLVLGYGAHEDMASALVPAILEARARAEAEGRHLSVVAHVCGTEADPQGLAAQEARLRMAGVRLGWSNATAALLAALIVTEEGGTGHVR